VLTLLILLLSFATATVSQAADFKLYATFTEDTRVELSDGAVWMMDKGDVFPIEAYKNMQKNVILRLAGSTFMTETSHIRVLKPDEVPAGIETYRNNVRSYLDATSKKMEQKLKEISNVKPEVAKADETKPTEAKTDSQKTDETKPEEKKAEKSEEPKPEEKK
jgi:ribosomal protein L12E/L44/L45/RPP1/RPP2